MKKYCKSCNSTKESIEFYSDISKKDGLEYRCKECKKEYSFKNSIHISAKRKDNYLKNISRYSTYNKEYHKLNKDKNNERRRNARKDGRLERDTHKRRAKRLNAKYESGITIKKLIIRDGNKCIICNKRVLDINVSGYHKDNGTIGHIIAMANGGSHTWSNVQLECMECNTKKGVKNGGQLRLF